MLSDARREEAYAVLREWASAKEIRHHRRGGLSFMALWVLAERSAPVGTPGSSTLDARERSFLSFPGLAPLPIGRRLREGAGQRVQDAQPRQRHEIIELVGGAPEEASSPGVSHRDFTRPIAAAIFQRRREVPPRRAAVPRQGLRRAPWQLCENVLVLCFRNNGPMVVMRRHRFCSARCGPPGRD